MRINIKSFGASLFFLLFFFNIKAQNDSLANKYPKLAVLYYRGNITSQAAITELGCYGLVISPCIMSSLDFPGGQSLGIYHGYGANHDTIYDFSHRDIGIPQQSIYYVKQHREDIKFAGFSMGPRKIELEAFYNDTQNPERYLVDNVSPKWFAYTILAPVQSDVSNNPFDTVFQFDSITVRHIYKDLKNPNIPDNAIWLRQYMYDWTYMCFKDNDSNATRGNFEIMAIKKVDTINNVVIVALKRENGDTLGRTIFGHPMSYSAGDRAGLLATSGTTTGSCSALMNPYYNPSDPKYKTEMLTDTNDLNSDWIGALTDYLKKIFMHARVNNTFLCDGIVMDTDNEYWKEISFHLANPADPVVGYQLDLNWDGSIDNIDSVNSWLPNMYHNLLYRIDTAAQSLNRDFFVIRNGHITQFGNSVGYVVGRMFEEFGFTGQDSSYEDALNQYMMLSDTNNSRYPHITMLTERDRDSAQVHQYNIKEHRHKMALATVLGDGFYSHTGIWSAHIHNWGNDTSMTDGPEDWFDEYAVDSNGTSAKLLPAQSDIDVANNRANNIGWLGFAHGKGYKIDSAFYSSIGWVYTFRRDFDNGIVLYSQYPHTVNLETSYKKINGADYGNDGSIVNSITFSDSKMGIFLVKTDITATGTENKRTQINIFPNPTNTLINISFDKIQNNISYRLTDVTGQTIIKKQINKPSRNYSIDISNLPSGLYILNVSNNNNEISKKIVITK